MVELICAYKLGSLYQVTSWCWLSQSILHSCWQCTLVRLAVNTAVT